MSPDIVQQTGETGISCQIIEVSQNLLTYISRIEPFLDLIPYQTEFFDLTVERFLHSKICIMAMHNQEIAGMAGVLPRKGFMSVYIVVEKKFRGQGIARKLSYELIAKAAQRYHIIAAMVEAGNDVSLQLHQKLGYQLIGLRNEFYYTFLPFDFTGRIILFILKQLFPVLKFSDRFRD
jgi:GNAT superfamily N-acetyltransferase